MSQTRRPGRPREWVLEDEIVEIHRLSFELKTRNPKAHWSAIKELVRTQLEQTGREKLLPKLDKLWDLMLHVVPLPPRCICGERVYSYAYRKVESDFEHYWEIFARCTNPSCRFLRRYLPETSYSWSRPKSAIKEPERLPTFYELDGQKVEGDE